MSNFLLDQALAILKRYIDDNHGGVRVSAAEALGLSNTTLSQWLTGKRTPNLESLAGPFSVIGVGFAVRGEAVAPSPAASAPSAEEERLSQRVTELKAELAKERALREQAERLFGVMAGGRTQAQPAPAVEEKRIPGTMPQATRCSDSD